MKRVYEKFIIEHLKKYPQMAFIVGPRQVGKTTLAVKISEFFEESHYLNWDVVRDRQKILQGQTFIEEIFPLRTLREEKPLIIFDEIHKYRDWKNYLKGFYDLYKNDYHILVTGSSRLDVYQVDGDSLMGRYFQYHIHPLSVSELLFRTQDIMDDQFFFNPLQLDEETLETLYEYGGFPDPFLLRSKQYSARWNSTRMKQLIYEDIQSISHLHELSLLEVLAEFLKNQAGQMVNRSSLAKNIQVTTQTVSRWIAVLERFYYCFIIKPWHKNVTRSLIKEPKVYLWDWSVVEDSGQKFENFVASHLLKFIQFYRDVGLGEFDLYYLRDLDKKEVDFLITKEGKPFFLIEAKTSFQVLSKSLEYFQKHVHATWGFHLIKNLPYSGQSCFDLEGGIWKVPGSTLLSQLI